MEVMEIRAMRDLDHQCSDISLTDVFDGMDSDCLISIIVKIKALTFLASEPGWVS